MALIRYQTDGGAWCESEGKDLLLTHDTLAWTIVSAGKRVVVPRSRIDRVIATTNEIAAMDVTDQAISEARR